MDPVEQGQLEAPWSLYKLLNKCVEAHRKALGDSMWEYYRDLNFVEWDNPTQDGRSGRHSLKPDLVGGINLPERKEPRKMWDCTGGDEVQMAMNYFSMSSLRSRQAGEIWDLVSMRGRQGVAGDMHALFLL